MAGRSNPNPSGSDTKSRPAQGSQDLPAEAGSADELQSMRVDETVETSMPAASMSPETSRLAGGQEAGAYGAHSERGASGPGRQEEEPRGRREGTGHRRYDERDEDNEDEVRGAWMPDTLTDNVGSVATAATVVVGAALLEAELIPGLVIGAGAVLLGMMFPQVRHAVRPVLKTAVRAGLTVVDKAREVAAEAGEQVQDVVAEVRSEREQHGMRSRRRASHGAGRRTERPMREDDRDLGDAIPA